VNAAASPHRQRVDSAAAVAAARAADGRNVLHTLEQRGGAKIRLPRPAGSALEAVLINTAGGLTGGDRIDWQAEAMPGAQLSLSTAASEKLYRSDGEAAQQATRLRVGDGARLDWLPQETIVFDGARLDRRLEVELHEGGTLLAMESLLFGRRAMGEQVSRGRLRDHWRIRRGGKLLHAEALDIDAAIDLVDASPAGFGDRTPPWRALLSAVLCVPDTRQVERLHDRVRATLDDAALRASASVLPQRLVLRALAPDGHALRRGILPALRLMAQGEMPRVWYV